MEKEKFLRFNQCESCKHYKMDLFNKELELDCCTVVEFIMKNGGSISSIDICPIDAMKIMKADE